MNKKYIKRVEDKSRKFDPRCETFILNKGEAYKLRCLRKSKIEYALTNMNFKIEQNIFKKVLVGFGLVVNRILNKIKG